LLSLPLAFGTRLETIPSTTPYLRAPVQALENWQARLGPKARPRIGLAWSGRPTHKNDKNRSISLCSLLPLLDIEATFVSLQKDVRADDAAVLKERNDILNFGDALKDFSDTAALISHLDLVISVDTSVAHLAGALGKPVWVLLPFIPDWRWLLDRDDSPWYPTARLFRQSETREWNDVIERIHEALPKFLESRR
jgi:ADP-heptose:LPS heptosyltransferase